MTEKFTTFIQQPPLRAIYAVAWTALAILLLLQSSGQPAVGPPAPPGEPVPSREVLMLLGHAVVFTGMTALWWWAFRIASPHHRALIISVVAVLVIGALTELLQSFVPDRSASLEDFAVNWLMTIATALVIQSRLRLSPNAEVVTR